MTRPGKTLPHLFVTRYGVPLALVFAICTPAWSIEPPGYDAPKAPDNAPAVVNPEPAKNPPASNDVLVKPEPAKNPQAVSPSTEGTADRPVDWQRTTPSKRFIEIPAYLTVPLVKEMLHPLGKSSKSTVTVPQPDETLSKFFEAVSGKQNTDDINNLLRGVTRIQRKGDSVEICMSDGTTSVVAGDTEFGGRVRKDVAEAEEKLEQKFGSEVAALVKEFIGISFSGGHIDVIRQGPEQQELDLSEHKIKKKLPLKRIKLSKIGFDVVELNGHPMLSNIEGIEVVPNTGLEVPIILKEFSRSKNDEGDDVLTFGIKNPMPKPLRKLFGMKEIMPISWTAKKKPEKEIGAKEAPKSEEQDVK